MRALAISANLFEDIELAAPMAALQLSGVEVEVASPDGGTITGKHGATYQSDLDVASVNPTRYTLLLLPGGRAPADLRQHPSVLEVARHWMDADKPVAAICHGPQILISAERVTGRRMTGYSGIGQELQAAGADYQDEPVVTDGKLVTSREPGDLPVFISQMLRTIGVPNTAD
jgi:protease I